MDRLEENKLEVRKWFKDHVIKENIGDEGFQRISFGKPGTRMYQVDYVLSNNMVFVTGDLGDAVYALTCPATIENIKRFDLSYFTGKFSGGDRDKYTFDTHLAQEEVESLLLDYANVDHYEQLDEEMNELLEDLYHAAVNSSNTDHFKMAVFSIYDRSTYSWFDSEIASTISEYGQELSRSLIAYWTGLQMIAEKLDS